MLDTGFGVFTISALAGPLAALFRRELSLPRAPRNKGANNAPAEEVEQRAHFEQSPRGASETTHATITHSSPRSAYQIVNVPQSMQWTPI
jgi:hypothetical protein